MMMNEDEVSYYRNIITAKYGHINDPVAEARYMSVLKAKEYENNRSVGERINEYKRLQI